MWKIDKFLIIHTFYFKLVSFLFRRSSFIRKAFNRNKLSLHEKQRLFPITSWFYENNCMGCPSKEFATLRTKIAYFYILVWTKITNYLLSFVYLIKNAFCRWIVQIQRESIFTHLFVHNKFNKFFNTCQAIRKLFWIIASLILGISDYIQVFLRTWYSSKKDIFFFY